MTRLLMPSSPNSKRARSLALPWSSIMPRNIQGRSTTGSTFLLGMQGYQSPFWLTFNQCKTLGGNVRKGEKATPVVFWRWIIKEDPDAKPGEVSSATKRIPFLRYYSVFNIQQCEGITAPELPVDTTPKDPIAAAEAIVAGYPDPPRITFGGTSAHYVPSLDTVNVPHRADFDSSESYDTLFHELVHSMAILPALIASH